MSSRQTQATLILNRIERRLSVDTISYTDWLCTTVDQSDGQLHIVRSMRYSDEDVRQHGAAEVERWIAEDHRRYQAFQNGEWWFVDAQAVAVIGVHVGEEKLCEIMLGSMIIGGIESDAGREHLDEFTEILVREIGAKLADLGFSDLDEVETPYVLSEAWVADAI